MITINYHLTNTNWNRYPCVCIFLSLSFDFTEFYAKPLGPNALPREWYLIPADVHLPVWEQNLHFWPSYGTHIPSKWEADVWPGLTVKPLDDLYRRALAAVDMKVVYHAANIVSPPPKPKPCTFIGPCQNASVDERISLQTTVRLTGDDAGEATMSVFDGQSCDNMRLVLYVRATVVAKDNGPNPVSLSFMIISVQFIIHVHVWCSLCDSVHVFGDTPCISCDQLSKIKLNFIEDFIEFQKKIS